MIMSAAGTAIHIEPRFRAEFPLAVDGKAIRVTIEEPAIEYLLGGAPADEEQVRAFLSVNRRRIERAVMARLFARGVPVNGELSMAAEDFGADVGDLRALVEPSRQGSGTRPLPADPSAPQSGRRS
jgi:hypothetical protein